MERICSKCGYRTTPFGISLLTGEILCPFCKQNEKYLPGFEEARQAVVAETGIPRDPLLYESRLPKSGIVDPGPEPDDPGPDDVPEPDDIQETPMAGSSRKPSKKKPKQRRKKRRH